MDINQVSLKKEIDNSKKEVGKPVFANSFIPDQRVWFLPKELSDHVAKNIDSIKKLEINTDTTIDNRLYFKDKYGFIFIDHPENLGAKDANCWRRLGSPSIFARGISSNKEPFMVQYIHAPKIDLRTDKQKREDLKNYINQGFNNQKEESKKPRISISPFYTRDLDVALDHPSDRKNINTDFDNAIKNLRLGVTVEARIPYPTSAADLKLSLRSLLTNNIISEIGRELIKKKD